MLVFLIYVAWMAFVFGVMKTSSEKTSEMWSGIDNYDKAQIVKDNWDDMDSLFLIFPDDISKIKNGKFASNIKSDLISSYGYIILEAYYEETDYLLEVNRLSEISYDLKNYYLGKEEHKVQKIKYEDDMYNYPAYITSDGYCGGYEYALIDDNNNRVIYIHLSYPVLDEIQEFSDYLKIDKDSYSNLKETSKENFTIYAYKFHKGSTAECSY